MREGTPIRQAALAAERVGDGVAEEEGEGDEGCDSGLEQPGGARGPGP